MLSSTRRMTEALREPIKNELQRMVDNDIIMKVEEPTDWVHNLVYVSKDNGYLCICLDP